MIDFAEARRMMVDGQIRTSDVTDLRLIAAMFDIPRERFAPHAKAQLAYLDFDLPVTHEGRELRRPPPAQAGGSGQDDSGRRREGGG